jgi:hypothetical protein
MSKVKFTYTDYKGGYGAYAEIYEDGTLGLGVISWDKIAQVEGDTVTFDGGNAVG